MISRRSFMAALSALPVSLLLGSPAIVAKIPQLLPSASTPSSAEDMTKYVKISIGTGGHGHSPTSNFGTEEGATPPSLGM